MPSSSRLGRIVRALGRALRALVVTGLVLFLLVCGVVVVLQRSGAVLRLARYGLQQGELALGRPLSVTDARLYALPLELELRGLRVGPAQGALGPASEPLLLADAVSVRVALWPLVLSLGRVVSIPRVEVLAPRVLAVRAADGGVSWDDLGRRLPRPPLPARQQELLGRLRIDHVEVRQGSVQILDQRAPRAVLYNLTQVALRADDVRLGRVLRVAVDAAFSLRDDPARFPRAEPRPQNLHLEAALGPLPQDLGVADPLGLVHQVRLRAGDVELPLPFGGPLWLRAEAQADVDRGELVVPQLEAQVGAMKVRARAELRGLRETPAIHQLEVRSQGLTLEGLMALLPPGLLPPDLSLRGPLEVYARDHGAIVDQQIEAGVDLTHSEIRHPWFRKPAGLRCGLGVIAHRAGAGVLISGIGVDVGSLAVWLTGELRSPTSFALRAEYGRVELERILQLVPPMDRATRRRQGRVSGHLSFLLDLRREGPRFQGEGRLDFHGARLALPQLGLTGSGRASATLRDDGRGGTYSTEVELSGARLWARGLINKEAGQPLALRARLERDGPRLRLQGAQLRVPGAETELRASADLASGALKIESPRVSLRLQELAAALPLMRLRSAPDLRAQGAVQVSGQLTQPAGWRLAVSGLELQARKGRLRGQAEVHGFSPLGRVTFDLSGGGFDLGPLLRPAATPRAPLRAGPILTALRALDLQGRLLLLDTRVADTLISELEADLRAQAGQVEVRVLRAAAFGGTVSLGGSRADLAADPPRYELRARVQRLDLRQALSLAGPQAARKVGGRVSVEASAAASGLRWADLGRSLRGDISATLTDGVVRDIIARVRIVNPGLKGLVGPDGVMTIRRDSFPLGALTVRARLEDQRVTLAEPLRFANRELVAKVVGNIGLLGGGALALQAALEILPEGLAVATGRKLLSAAAIPVQVTIGGSPALPVVEVDKLDETIAAAVGGVLGVERAPEISAPRPSHDLPGESLGVRAAPLRGAGPASRAGPFQANVALGPAFGLWGLPGAQLALRLDLGYAVTRSRLGYVMLPLQLQRLGEPVLVVMAPLSVGYDLPIPFKAFYLSMRVGLGYAYLLDHELGQHMGVALLEGGVKYVPIRRLNFGLDLLSLPVLFDRDEVRLSYRLMAYGGVNF